jgi:hypothetical protein
MWAYIAIICGLEIMSGVSTTPPSDQVNLKRAHSLKGSFFCRGDNGIMLFQCDAYNSPTLRWSISNTNNQIMTYTRTDELSWTIKGVFHVLLQKKAQVDEITDNFTSYLGFNPNEINERNITVICGNGAESQTKQISFQPSGIPAIPDSIECNTTLMNNTNIFVNCSWKLPGFTDDVQHVDAEIQCDGKQMHNERLHKENLYTTGILPLVVNGNYSILITTTTFCDETRNVSATIGVNISPTPPSCSCPGVTGISTTPPSCSCADCFPSQESSSSGVIMTLLAIFAGCVVVLLRV